MAETKRFDVRDVGTVTTGIVLKAPFNAPEVIEYVLGHPVWTHELGDFSAPATDKIVEQWPDAPRRGFTQPFQELADALLANYPDGIELRKGSDERAVDPVATLQAKVMESH